MIDDQNMISSEESPSASEQPDPITGADQDDEGFEEYIEEPERFHTLSVMIGDIQNQNQAAVSTIDSISHKSGILSAFLSVAFIEALYIFDGTLVAWLLLFALATCIVIGVCTILYAGDTPTGPDVNKLGSMFNDEEFEYVMVTIYNERAKALRNSMDKVDRLTMMLRVQSVLLISGLAIFAYVELF